MAEQKVEPKAIEKDIQETVRFFERLSYECEGRDLANYIRFLEAKVEELEKRLEGR